MRKSRCFDSLVQPSIARLTTLIFFTYLLCFVTGSNEVIPVEADDYKCNLQKES